MPRRSRSFARSLPTSQAQVGLDGLPGNAATLLQRFPCVPKVDPILECADVHLGFARGARGARAAPPVAGAGSRGRTIGGSRLAELGHTAKASRRFLQGYYSVLDGLSGLLERDVEVVGRLQDHPSLRSRSEKTCEPQSRVRCDTPATAQNL